MTQLPNNLEDAIAQSRQATASAIENGLRRLQVELLFPEIQLQAQSIAQQFLGEFENLESGLKVLFPDTGAAALARRDWGKTTYKVTDLGSSRSPIENKIEAEDQLFLIINPSSIEVAQVEKLSQLAEDRPVILLIPRLEDIATIGIGYAARQQRERFLNTLESCYYIRPLEGAALFRCYPQPWQVWLERNGDYELIAELAEKPVGDALDQILAKASGVDDPSQPQPTPKPPKKSFMADLQSMWRALTR